VPPTATAAPLGRRAAPRTAPHRPSEPFAGVPFAVLTAIAIGLFAVGVIGFRRRDLSS